MLKCSKQYTDFCFNAYQRIIIIIAEQLQVFTLDSEHYKVPFEDYKLFKIYSLTNIKQTAKKKQNENNPIHRLCNKVM